MHVPINIGVHVHKVNILYIIMNGIDREEGNES